MKLRTAVGLGLAIVWGGCVQILDADYEYKPQCTADADCEDKNPCTTDVCSADQACEHTTLADGPLAQQVAGDCLRDDCIGGEVVSVADDKDVADDQELCTTDTCTSGSPVHTPLPDGDKCTVGMSAGQCVMGACSVDCGPTNPCDDMNPCTTDTCDESVSVCMFGKIDGMPTPGFQEPVGDCNTHVCVMGVDTVVSTDADIPDDKNSCTDDLCSNGVPSNAALPMGTTCMAAQMGTCDGQGLCVECNVASDCIGLPEDTECRQRTCVNNACILAFTAMGTAVVNQIDGDCQQEVCDGAGAIIPQPQDTDLPVDNNPCTKDVCANGVPSNPFEMEGFSCGGVLKCDAKGNCFGCTTAADCVTLPMDDACKKRACNNMMCEMSLLPAGTPLLTGQTSMDCKVLECDGAGNVITAPDITDKPVDNNQCTQDLCSMQGVPSNPFEPVTTACTQNGGTTCDGAGACKKADSVACSAAMECLSGFCVDGVCCNAACGASCQACNVTGSVGKCSNLPIGSKDNPVCFGSNSCDGTGTCKKDTGQACAASTECVSNFCVDGVCCANACTTPCRTCNQTGLAGQCLPIFSGEDNVPVNVCNGNKSCDMTGNCKLDNGQTCATGGDCTSGQCFDGVCCNVACSGTCKSCSIMGSVGVCSNVALGQDDANGVPACSGTNQSCDGMGACKKENGQTCAAASECLSGSCADGVCCDTACNGTCQACNLTAKVGTCANVPAGQDDTGTCTGTNQSCDGSGACKLEIGIACAAGTSCLSSFCVDGFCCNTACTGTCQACSAALQGQGSNGTCGPIVTGTDPSNECANGSCNGANTCKLDLGAVCSSDTQCLSGFCIDGVCCNSACGNGATTDCLACSVANGASMNGSCGVVAAGKVCRAQAGACDVVETCNGVSNACPADVLRPMGTVCRVASDVCDVSESCSGISAQCPPDMFQPNVTVCRPVLGDCDIVETCSGSSASCPIDNVNMAGTVCRAAMSGGCDVAETCDGMSNSCPMDAVSPMGTVCRVAAAGGCDVAEVCDGANASCPMDALQPAGTSCGDAQSCTNSTQTNADTCDAVGTCVDNGTTSCGNYVCEANACRTSCMNDTDCTTGFTCFNSVCQ